MLCADADRSGMLKHHIQTASQSRHGLCHSPQVPVQRWTLARHHVVQLMVYSYYAVPALASARGWRQPSAKWWRR
jgi:hypothetical protein